MSRLLRSLISGFVSCLSNHFITKKLELKEQMLGGRSVLQAGSGLLGAAAVLGLAFGAGTAKAQTLVLMGEQTSVGSLNGNPHQIVFDASGNAYVADDSGGVYKETYSGTPGVYTQTKIAVVNSPGSVALDPSGDVYVSTEQGYVYEYKVSSSSSTGYASATQVAYLSGDLRGMAIDSSGNLFVIQDNTGAIYKFAAGTFGESALISGGNTTDAYGLGIDANNNLYVGDESNGRVIKYTLSGGTYSAATYPVTGLSNPQGVSPDALGDLYIATGAGVVKAVYNSSAGTYTTQIVAPNSVQVAAVDAAGDLFLLPYGQASLTEYVKSPSFGSVAVGTAASQISLTFYVQSSGTLNAPQVVTQGVTGLDYSAGVTSPATCSGAVVAGAVCTVNVAFTPRFTGARFGAANLLNASGTVIGTGYVSGTGTGPQVVMLPGTQSVVSTDVTQTRGVVTDAAGNLFVLNTDNSSVQKETPSGGSYVESLAFSGTNFPYAIAIDGAGDIYSAEFFTGQISKWTPSGGIYTRSVVGNGNATGVAVDSAGNVYFVDGFKNNVTKLTLTGGSYTANVIASGFIALAGVAVDAKGNVYVSDSNAGLKKLTPSGSGYNESSVGSLTSAQTAAVDGNGNLYIASGYSIYQELVEGTGYVEKQVVSGLKGIPYGMALDAQGNLYLSIPTLNELLKLDLADTQSFSFGSAAVGTVGGAQTATVQNIGDAVLTFTLPGSGTNPKFASSNFTLGGSSTCPVVTTSTKALAAGASCTEVINFTPVMAGNIGDSLAITDTNLNSISPTQNIAVSGTATPGFPVVTVSHSNALAGSTTASLSATVSYGGVPPSGTATFAVGSGAAMTATCTAGTGVNTCTASYPVSTLASGNYTITVAIAADSNYSAAGNTGTLTAVPASYVAPSMAVGITSTTQIATVVFTTAGTLGSINVVTQGSTGLDFGYVAGGTNACVTGTAYVAGQACTVQYSFTPITAGLRQGAAVLKTSTGSVAGTVYLSGVGNGPEGVFTQGISTALATTGSTFDMVRDGGGNLYVNSGAQITKIAAGTYAKTLLLTGVGSGGLGLDGAGNLYFNSGNGTLSELVGAQGSPVAVATGLCFIDIGIATDAAGNLYLPCTDGSDRILKLAAGTLAQTSYGQGFLNHPLGVSIDASGNMFVSDSNNNRVVEITPGGTVTTVANLPQPTRNQFDAAGDLYVGSLDGSVHKLAASSFSNTTIATPSTSGIFSMLLDPSGNLLGVDYSSGTVYLLNRSTGGQAYPATPVGGSTTGVAIPYENDGNLPLTMSAISASLNFAVDSTLTSCSTGVALASAASCNVGADFAPQIGGPQAGTLTLTDNSLNMAGSTQTMTLSGVATAATPVVVVGSAAVSAGGTATVSAVVTYQGSMPTGIFSFTLGASTVPATCVASANQETCTATLPATGLAVGSYPVTGSLASDISYNTAAGTGTLTVVPTSFAAPSTPVAGTPATLTATLVFNGPVTLNGTLATAIQVVTQGAPNLDFTYAAGETCAAGSSYTAGQSCTVNVSFNPKAPGQRLGAVILFDNSATPVTVATSLLSGIGTAPLAVIYPGTQTTVVSNLPDTFGIAVDSSNNLYVGDIGDGSLVKETPQPGGGYVATTIDPNLGFFGNIAVDGAGNVFVAAHNNNQVVEEQLNIATGVYTPIVVFNSANNGLNQPYGLAIDGAGAIYVGNGGQLLKETPRGSGYTQTLVDGTLGDIIGLAVDGSGNLYVADGGNAALLKETFAGGSYTQSTIATGLGNANGVAVDAGGTVYVVADASSNQVLRYAPNGSGGYTPLTSVGQFNRTNGVALAANGNLFVTDDGAGGLVYRIDVADPQTLPFSATAAGGSNGPQMVEFDNIGNAALTISTLASSSTNFTVNAATTTCSTSAGLASAANCNLGVTFTPQAGGALTGMLNIADNSLNATSSAQLVNLTGTGTQATPVLAVANVTTVYGTPATTLSATVTYPGSTAPTGAFIFTVGSGAAVTASCTAGTSGTATCTASYPTAALTVNSYTITGSLTADTSYAAASMTGTLAVTQATPLLAVTNVTTSFSNSNATLTATLAYPGALPPTGVVTFSVGGTAITAACAGTASPLTCTGTLPLAGAALGVNTINVNVAADTNYMAATATGTLNLTAATATVTVASATAVYGTVNTTLTASVAYTGSTAPTGAFSFTVGSGPAVVASCTGTVSPLSCTVAYPTSALAVNSYTITGSLAGDTRFAISTGTGSLTITPALPTIAVANQTISYGTATATLSATYPFSGATPPMGAVTFMVDAGAAVSATCSTTTSVRTCTASYPTAFLTAGAHSIKASAAADANFSAATGTGTLTVTSTTPAVTVTGQSIAYGTADATLSASVAFTGSVPSGAVTFTIDTGAAVAATCSGIASPRTCSASYPTSTLAVGTHTVKASFAGDANYSASSATGSLAVTATTPVITVASVSASYGAATATLNANVTFTGAVPASAVMFTVDSGAAVTAGCTGTTSPLSCTATYPVASLMSGTHTITATLAAGSNYAAASGAGTLTLVVTNATISLAVANHSYGDPAFTVAATSNSTGAFTYTVISGPATVSGSTVTLNGIGSVILQASQAADANFVAGAKQASFTVSAATLTATAANATRVYGAANPAFTGTVTGAKYSDAFTENFTTAATASSPVGTYAIAPAVAGADLGDYTATTTDGTLTVTQATTATSFTSSAATLNPNQTVTFNAAVASTTTGTPTGTATFFDNGTALSTVPLVNGAAAYTTTLAPATTNSITVMYSGDTNFLTSTTAMGVPVTVGALDFTFASVGSGAYTATPGKVATFNFALAPDFTTYSGTVNLSVTGLPVGATASFSPATVAGTGGPQAVVMTVQTPQSTAENKPDPMRRDWPALALLVLPVLGSGQVRRKLGARMLMLVLLMAGLGGAGALTGCGTGNNGLLLQTPSTYTLTVTATSGILQHSQTVTLTVQ